jgi:hypothetical protein
MPTNISLGNISKKTEIGEKRPEKIWAVAHSKKHIFPASRAIYNMSIIDKHLLLIIRYGGQDIYNGYKKIYAWKKE